MNDFANNNVAAIKQHWRLYAMAVAFALATLGARVLLMPWVADRPLLLLFVVPMILSAYVGGLGPGLTCTVVVGICTAYFVMPPAHSFSIATPLDLAQWMLLVLIGVMVSLLRSESARIGADKRSTFDDKQYLSTERKVRAGFAIALACLAIIGVVSYLSVIRLQENSAWVAHTKDVIIRLDSLFAGMTDAEAAQRGYVIRGDEAYKEPFRRAAQAIDTDLQSLHLLVEDNPVQQQRLEALAPILKQRLAISETVIGLRQSQGFEAAQREILKDNGRLLQEKLRDMIGVMKTSEEDLLKVRERMTQESSTLTESVIIGGGVLAFGFVGFALFRIRRDFVGRQQAEAQLDRFFSLSLDFLCISSSDGYFKRVSPAVTDILGWSVTEFLARPFIDFVHPEDHAATLVEVEKQVMRHEKVLHFENRYRHKDGSWRVLSWRSMPQPDGLMYATARDVTEFKRTEVALREAKDQMGLRVRERTAELALANESLRNSEHRFRALIEHGSDSIALIDAENKILYLSPAVAAVEGYTPEELVGRLGTEHTHPDDLVVVEKAVQQLLQKPGIPISVLWRRKHKKGHWVWLEGFATNLLGDPAVRAIVTNYRDVTERKLAEAKLQAQLSRLALLSQITRSIGERQDIHSIFQIVIRTLEEQMPLDFSCICLYDAGANSLIVNSVGIRSESLAMELAMTEQARIEIDQNGLSRCVAGELVYEADISDVKFPFPQRLARVGLHAMVCAPLCSENKVFGVLITARLAANSFSSGENEFLRQLSEHVALAAHQAQLYKFLQVAYEDLRQTQQAVMQQERLRVLGQMASGIAHDINNAISPITLYTESLLEREPGLSARARDYLQTIQQAIADVAETVTRMREFYRQRETQLAPTTVYINILVTQVVELTRARWEDMPQQRGVVIQLQTDLAPNLPAILGVESEIRESLTNLIFNAVDAMPQGGVLTLRTSSTAPVVNKNGHGARKAEGSQVFVEVSDTGVGMDEETRRRCLELFFTTKGERGTGLGLAMVYGMAQRHNAELEIDSEIGKGTCVRLSFNASNSGVSTHTTTEYRVPENLHILVVDDDPVLLKSLRDTLAEDGHTIVTANGGQIGIDTFAAAHNTKQRFDLVITDLGMPFIDGRKVASAIKAMSASTPVIMLTGWGQRLVTEGETPADVDRVLSKPPRLRELRAALSGLLNS